MSTHVRLPRTLSAPQIVGWVERSETHDGRKLATRVALIHPERRLYCRYCARRCTTGICIWRIPCEFPVRRIEFPALLREISLLPTQVSHCFNSLSGNREKIPCQQGICRIGRHVERHRGMP